MFEVKVNGQWVQVTEYIFRSWTGGRRIDGEPYHGPVFYLGTDEPVARRAGEAIHLPIGRTRRNDEPVGT